MDEFVKYLKALVYLQAHQFAEAEDGEKVEHLLARSGLSHKDVADILGKNEAAIAKSVSRAKLSTKKKGSK